MPPLPGPWAALTKPALDAIDKDAAVAVLPVGAVEQHGPHLPLGTDIMIAEDLLAQALGRLAPGTPILTLPPQAVGWSPEHADYAGTLSQAPDVLTCAWGDIGRAVAGTGIRKLVLFNGHGGQPELLEIVCRTLRMEHDMLAFPISWFGFGLPPLDLPAEEINQGIHAGAIETALMRALRPHLVDEASVTDFPAAAPAWAERYAWLSPRGPLGFAWAMRDLNPSGAVGDARLGTTAMGQQIADHVATALAGFLAELSAARPNLNAAFTP